MNFNAELGRAGYVDVESSDTDPELRTGHCGTARGAGAALRVVLRGSAVAAVAGLLGVVVVRSAPHSGATAGSSAAASSTASVPPAAASTMELVELGASVAGQDLKPLELLHDGNVCDTSEELFGGLCYKKCALLTEGRAGIRTSSWTCCKSHPCTPFNELGRMGTSILCNGFDVAGDGSCPHKPGACLVDEELYLGVCYEKCNILTQGGFPNRVGPATCCKTKGLGCLNFKNDKTNQAFAVGGGEGDKDAGAHLPEKSLTEDSASQEAVDKTAAPVASPSKAVEAPAAPAALVGQLKPEEHMNDGNVCADDEELYGGLCYGKCAVLTKGEAPIRTSSWTCCEQHPCGLWNQRGSLGTSLLCNGYDVSADGSCPHKPGACLVDEEMHLGVCYEKCSLLTEGEFPHRIAAATCCKVKGLGCLNLHNVKTSDAFDKGGGAGDHDAATPAAAHAPSESLTEQEDTPEPSAPELDSVANMAPKKVEESVQKAARTSSQPGSSSSTETDSSKQAVKALGSALPPRPQEDEDQDEQPSAEGKKEAASASKGSDAFLSQAGQQPARWSFTSSDELAAVERKLRSTVV